MANAINIQFGPCYNYKENFSPLFFLSAVRFSVWNFKYLFSNPITNKYTTHEVLGSCSSKYQNDEASFRTLKEQEDVRREEKEWCLYWPLTTSMTLFGYSLKCSSIFLFCILLNLFLAPLNDISYLCAHLSSFARRREQSMQCRSGTQTNTGYPIY